MTLGLILAGGRSRRFGGDKAVALLGGVSLLARARNGLAGVCDPVGVNAPADSEAARLTQALGAPLVSDPPGAPLGPLAGVLAGLAWARAQGQDRLVTLPCDAPFLPVDLADRLLAALGSAPAAVARSPDGLQPLCAVWRTTMLETLQAHLAKGAHPPVHAVLEQVGAVEVSFSDARAFLNINGPQDLAEAERRLSGA